MIDNPLLALIKDRGLLDDLQIEEVLQEQARSGKSFMQVLQDMGMVDMDTQLQIIAEHLGTEVVHLANLDIPPRSSGRFRPRPPGCTNASR